MTIIEKIKGYVWEEYRGKATPHSDEGWYSCINAWSLLHK